MRYVLMCWLFISFGVSAEVFKCFDGVRPKYTYQNMPCEDVGLKTAKKITDKDAVIGSADFSGYRREARERADISRTVDRDFNERRNIEYQRSGAGQRQSTAAECASLIEEKRSIVSMQRQKSTAWLHQLYAENRKRMQAIDCQGL
ncbi:hypothetical protein [Janthinobacterium sp. B9-8]|uniref:hypothetical protein n=1 Tax=Janthinobacterium sp. B9-8 TaxID=1236179 RepID=UPI00061D1C08|nr:hypothetical protein [Janthinobacterium sp. B9-8]AMC34219.1 hypothetical protein VN23_06230 [Janthinobacterium sp. B9-8]